MGDLEELHSRGVNFVLISFVFVSANSKGSLFLTLSVLNFKIQDLVLSPNFYICDQRKPKFQMPGQAVLEGKAEIRSAREVKGP